MDQRIPDHDGDARTEVFAELYAAHYRPLVALCRRYVGGTHAEELAQEAFLRAWSSWERYAPSRPFWPWVSTIARRLCIDHGRRVRTAQLRGPHAADTRGTVLPTPEEQVEASEEYRWARAALAQLRPDQQRVLRLHEVEGWSYDRIADHEGVTVESVRGSLRRARSRLRVVYARMASSNPVVVVLGALRGMRRRVTGWAHRAEGQAAATGVLTARASEAVAAIMALAIGTGGVALPGVVGGRAAAAAAGSSPPALVTATAPGQGPQAVSAPTTVADRRNPGNPLAARRDGPARSDLDINGAGVKFPGRGEDNPEATSFQSFTPSPRYERDHEIYASGYTHTYCATSCPSLFHSTDGGASWTRIRTVGFEGGPVLLPPSFPADRRIFVAGPHALKVSSDGGHTFTPLTPAGGYAAMSPGFSSGNPDILVGAIPGWIYHDDTKAVTPFDKVPQSTSVALSFAYSPAYPSHHRIVVGGTDATPDANSTVSACDGSACTPPAFLPGSEGTPAVLTSRSYRDTGLTFAWNLDRMYRSTDGGASFSPIVLPAGGQVEGVAEDGTGRLYVALLDNGVKGPTGGLFMSIDSGTSWTRLGADTSLDRGVLSVVALPGNKLLAGPYGGPGGGVVCSTDGGRNWAARCS